MQKDQNTDLHGQEWAEKWSLSKADSDFIVEKPASSHLDYALKITFYRQFGRFPLVNDDILGITLDFLADQVGSRTAVWKKPNIRTEQRRKNKVLEHLEISEYSEEIRQRLNAFLEKDRSFRDQSFSSLRQTILFWCVRHKVLPPGNREIERTHSALAERFANAEYSRICELIPEQDQLRILKSLGEGSGHESLTSIRREITGSGREAFYGFAQKLQYINSLCIPHDYIASLDREFVDTQANRVSRYEPREIRRFADTRKIAMYVVYLHRSRLVFTDKLISIMLDAVHGVYERSKREVRNDLGKKRDEYFSDLKLLTHILRAYQSTPGRSISAIVEEVMSPTDVSDWLTRSQNTKNPAAATFEKMRARWKSYYRPMLRVLIETLKFRANIASQTPLLNALDWILDNFDARRPVNPETDDIPIDGVLTDTEKKDLLDKDGYIDRYHYELCVASRLRTAIKGRAVWVAHSAENGNPDADLPEDFDHNPEVYYADLGLTRDAKEFISSIRSEMEEQLLGLNNEILKNPGVKVEWSTRPRFRITDFPPAKEPPGIARVKAELVSRWSDTSLLDILKETALDTGFLKEFKTIGDRLNLDQSTINERLLLTIFGTGTNAGLKAMAGSVSGVTYNHLQHIQRRLMSPENLRRANARVSNAILAIRDPQYWGEQGTACASDSKQYPAWDNNLGTEYHARYQGNGIMVYWHVDRKSMCIYSRLKSVRSNEVASMIEGVLRHCTNMEIDTQYTDSHGQTEVGFAFAHLLAFQLAPRIKGVGKSKLYLPSRSIKSKLDDIAPMLTRPIDWKLIAKEFHEMARYASALKNRDNSPERVLRKFTRSGVMHPTYKALQELGRAMKTIFVCRYLRSEALRREIQEGLNVMENWNGATRFVLFGKSGEFTSRREEDREMTVQALHLLQNSMVYVNTQMFQTVLSGPGQKEALTSEDFRALTPLIHAHVNPFGRYVLDMNSRIEGLLTK